MSSRRWFQARIGWVIFHIPYSGPCYTTIATVTKINHSLVPGNLRTPKCRQHAHRDECRLDNLQGSKPLQNLVCIEQHDPLPNVGPAVPVSISSCCSTLGERCRSSHNLETRPNVPPSLRSRLSSQNKLVPRHERFGIAFSATGPPEILSLVIVFLVRLLSLSERHRWISNE